MRLPWWPKKRSLEDELQRMFNPPTDRIPPGILLDWPAIHHRVALLSEIPVAAAAGIDQIGALVRDFLELAGVDDSDPRDVFCVTAGIVLMDTIARHVNGEDIAFVADVCMTTLLPMATTAGIVL